MKMCWTEAGFILKLTFKYDLKQVGPSKYDIFMDQQKNTLQRDLWRATGALFHPMRQSSSPKWKDLVMRTAISRPNGSDPTFNNITYIPIGPLIDKRFIAILISWIKHLDCLMFQSNTRPGRYRGELKTVSACCTWVTCAWRHVSNVFVSFIP
jgi:hypothetical protein